MNKASPAEIQKILKMVDAMVRAGILFVPVPALNDAQHAELVGLCHERLDDALRIASQGGES